MSKTQRGLGRGLGAFFPGAGRAQPSMSGEIAIEEIAPNPLQPRRNFDEQSLQGLAASIKANGMLAPIIVRPRKGGGRAYEIVAGERRWRAARIAGLRRIPALVRDADDAQSLELALLENLQRADLNPIEAAVGLRQLLDDHGFTQEVLAQRLGRSRPAVTNALRLLTLPDAVQALVRDGKLSGGHARALAALPAQKAERLAREAVRGGWSVRDIERAAQPAAAPATKKVRRRSGADGPRLSPELAAVESRLRFALATRVSLLPARTGGKIEIQYANDDELGRLADHIAPEVR